MRRLPVEIAAGVQTGLPALSRSNEVEAEQAFAGMVERQARVMFRVAVGVLRDRAEAEDAVQEAFLRLLRMEGWRRAEQERAYVVRVVWRVAVDRARERACDRAMEDVAGVELPGAGESAEAAMVRARERGQLRRLIDGLPERLRQPLLLCAIEEMTSTEVAAVMGIAEGTVRTRVMQAKRELRRRFEAVDGRRR